MTAIPTPVEPSLTIEPVRLRNFRHPNYRVICNHCTWESYEYPNQDEADVVGLHHSLECCDRINTELAREVPVTPVAAEDLKRGDQLLLKDLRVLEVGEVLVDGSNVLLSYIMGAVEQELILPVGHQVKVVA